MECQYCGRYQNSKWRIKSEEESNKKYTPQERHCNIVNKYISGNREVCDHFEPYHLFWCNRNNFWQHVEACLARSKKGIDDLCFGCSQHRTIAEIQRKRHFIKLKAERDTDVEVEVESKPRLIRRNP